MFILKVSALFTILLSSEKGHDPKGQEMYGTKFTI